MTSLYAGHRIVTIARDLERGRTSAPERGGPPHRWGSYAGVCVDCGVTQEQVADGAVAATCSGPSLGAVPPDSPGNRWESIGLLTERLLSECGLGTPSVVGDPQVGVSGDLIVNDAPVPQEQPAPSEPSPPAAGPDYLDITRTIAGGA